MTLNLDQMSTKTAPAKLTRERLLESAMSLFYEQGVAGTTIAHVATASGVPLGNIYYHFRTKEALIAAVIEARRLEVQADIEHMNRSTTPLERLSALVRDSKNNRNLLTAHGCPYASLAHRLRDEDNYLADDAGALLGLYLEFAKNQFALLGQSDAAQLAADFMTRLYGAFSLANAMNSPEFLDLQLERLEQWLNRAVVK